MMMDIDIQCLMGRHRAATNIFMFAVSSRYKYEYPFPHDLTVNVKLVDRQGNVCSKLKDRLE